MFPLHPFDENGNNRTPALEELEWGMTILQRVVDLFPSITVVSVNITPTGIRRNYSNRRWSVHT